MQRYVTGYAATILKEIEDAVAGKGVLRTGVVLSGVAGTGPDDIVLCCAPTGLYRWQ